MDEHAMFMIVPENIEGHYEGEKKTEFRDISRIVTCLSLVCSFFPTGYFAVRYANKAKETYKHGRIEEANKLTRETILVTATTVLTPLILALTVIILVFFP